MPECRGCGVNSRRIWCEICDIVVPHITGQDSNMIESPAAVEHTRHELGHPDTRPNRIWSAIRKLDSSEAEWAMDARPGNSITRIGGDPPEWEIDDEDQAIMDSGSIRHASTARLRRLQRGGILPDGSHLSWTDGRFHLDGIPLDVPYHGLRKMMRRTRGIQNVDWKKLLLSVSLACTKHQTRRELRAGQHGRQTTIHPAAMMRLDGDPRRVPHFMRAMGLPRWGPPIERSRYRPDWFKGTSWMDAWDSLRPLDVNDMDDMMIPMALYIKDGHLQLRVRRNRGWRRLELESHPVVWSLLVSWSLAPPRSDSHQRLRCLQQSLFADTEIDLISKEERNGIRMLRGIVQDNDNVIVDRANGGFIVQGTSGARYRVVPGVGGHNTRFVVNGIGHESGQRPARERNAPPGWHRGRNSLCIVESRELRRLVIGDALSSITLSLLDDLKSQQYIDTLRGYIREVTPRTVDPQVAAVRQAENLRFRLRNNLAEYRTRRYTVLFPQLWGVMLRCPLGERMTFTAMRRGHPNVAFDGCETAFATEGRLERNVIYQMLEASGWQRDHHEERVRRTQRIYIRTGTGLQDLGNRVEEFAGMLEPALTVNQRVRLVANPVWSYFERNNPGTGALLPGTDQRLD